MNDHWNDLSERNDREESARTARNVLRTMLGAAVLGLLFLGAAVVLSGCELVYQPACTTQCQAAGGNDAYTGRGAM
ncbi:MAG: hypothetical protein [Arizlama microvirus]|nr:MAG: hypothetical protein [Arizlama microvirus]